MNTQSYSEMSPHLEENVDGKPVESQRSVSTHRYWVLRPGPTCWLYRRQEVPVKEETKV